MASAASSEIVSELVTDMEEVKVSETDAALLREFLLEDLDQSEERIQLEKDHGVHADAVENIEQNANSDYNYMNDVDGFDYWPDYMVEMAPSMLPPAPVDETMAWYVHDDIIATGEFDCNIDYSQLYKGDTFEEEATYGGLWQD